MGSSCPSWFILPPTKELGRTVSSVHSYCTIILEYLVAIIVEHYFSQTEMFTSNISLVTLVRGVGASCPGWFILPPRLGFVSGSVISQFLLHHNLGIFSCKRYKHYFRQTEMFTSNISLVTLVRGSILSEILGRGKINRTGQLAPPPPVNT